MNHSKLIKTLMAKTGFTCQSLADKLGKPTASCVSNSLNRSKSMRLDTLYDMVDAMGYEIVVRSKSDKNDELTLSYEPAMDFDLNLDELLD